MMAELEKIFFNALVEFGISRKRHLHQSHDVKITSEKKNKKKETNLLSSTQRQTRSSYNCFFFFSYEVTSKSSTLVQFFYPFCQIVAQRIQFSLIWKKRGGGNPLVLRRFIRSCAYVYVPLTSSLFLSLTSCVLAPSEQRCQCTSSGCTTCAARRRRYERSDRKEDRVKVVNVGPIVRTNRNRQPDPCTVATGCTGARVGSSSVPHCSPATPSMRSRSKYPGNVSSIARYLFSISLLILRGIYFHSGNS